MFTKRFLLTTALGLISTVISAYNPDLGEKFDKGRYIAQRIRDDVLPILKKYQTTRHVSVPNDAANWHLFVSHEGLIPRGPLVRMFQTDPRLKDFWNNPHVTAAYTGPSYRGWAEQSYAAILQPPGILLTDATGKKIYLARGSNIPATATALIAEINLAVADYHKDSLQKSIEADADQLETQVNAKLEAGETVEDYPLLPNESAFCEWFPGKIALDVILRRRNGQPRPLLPWNWGRRPCPVCPDEPTETPTYETSPPEPIADNADEKQPFNYAGIVMLLIGALTGIGYKTYQEM